MSIIWQRVIIWPIKEFVLSLKQVVFLLIVMSIQSLSIYQFEPEDWVITSWVWTWKGVTWMYIGWGPKFSIDLCSITLPSWVSWSDIAIQSSIHSNIRMPRMNSYTHMRCSGPQVLKVESQLCWDCKDHLRRACSSSNFNFWRDRN